MLPKQAIALAVLLARSHSSSGLEIAEVDASSLLQVPVRQVQQLHMKAKGSQLLETAHTIISKVNAGDDPSGCSAASDATRTLVDELLPGILEQHSHWSNQGNIAAEAVENCVSQGGDLAQQGIDLQTARTNHQACRLAEHGLDESLGACQQYEELRTSLGNRCFAFPNDEIGFPEAVQRARDELNVAFTQAQMLQQSCNTAREAHAEQHAECDLEQRRFEEDYCAYRANCAGVKACHANALGTYRQTEIEAQAALEGLRSEYQVLVHVQCLLGHADQALNQSAIVSGDAVAACSEPASTDELTISFPALDAVTTCESSIIAQAPCRADFFESEYSNLPQREAIQAACVECPATTTTTITMTETESLSPSDELVDQDAGILPRPAGAVELLSGNAHCPECTCEVSAPDPSWGNSGCHSMFDDDLRWRNGPGLHLQNDASLTVTFPSPELIDHVVLQQIQNHGNNYWRGDFAIETFNNGVWTVRARVDDVSVQNLPLEGDGRFTFQFAQPAVATKVRMNAGNPQHGNGGIYRLEELQVYGFSLS